MAKKKRTKTQKYAERAVKKLWKAPLIVSLTIIMLLLIAFGVCFILYKTENPGFMSFYNSIFNPSADDGGGDQGGSGGGSGSSGGDQSGSGSGAGSNGGDQSGSGSGSGSSGYGESDLTWDTDTYSATNSFIPIIGQTLSIHFLELGNEYSGDCVYIKAGDNDILVDAGSRANSISTIDTYLKQYVTDNKLEFVIVTHADRDHIAGFSSASNSLFDLYECETIIDFAKTNKETTSDSGGLSTYGRYLENLQEEVDAGATHYNVLQCYNNLDGAKRQYNLAPNITLNFLYQEFYENTSTDENNYSVCFMITENGNKHYLFTGDLEAEGEQSLVENNALSQVELFKAGHHGSKTSSNDFLLEVIRPKIVCVCCCAGSVEYTQNNANTFPTQDFINRVAKYTDKVYVTSRVNVAYDNAKEKYVTVGEYKLMNGNIVVKSDGTTITVKCSHDDAILKDTKWFQNKRECPPEWQVA